MGANQGCLLKKISFEAFENAELNSLTWYDFLPGDDVYVERCNTSMTAAGLADEILSVRDINDIRKIDFLAAKILNQCDTIADYRHWPELSSRLSKIMSLNLTAEGSRSLRMHAQRLVYYLQTIIDSGEFNSNAEYVISEIVLGVNKPWDYLRTIDGEWLINSDKKNLLYRSHDGKEICWDVGLPTQMDILPDGKISIGSLYTNGAVIVHERKFERVEHSYPIVLLFEHDTELYFLDNQCELWRVSPRCMVANSIRPQVHFSRYIDGIVYVLDNSDYGHISIFDMNTFNTSRLDVSPVQVCNDLVIVGQNSYLIDKQQGSIFKFDLDWNFIMKILSFGRKEGSLLDPVSIREINGRLFVVSWLTAKLTEVRLF